MGWVGRNDPESTLKRVPKRNDPESTLKRVPKRNDPEITLKRVPKRNDPEITLKRVPKQNEFRNETVRRGPCAPFAGTPPGLEGVLEGVLEVVLEGAFGLVGGLVPLGQLDGKIEGGRGRRVDELNLQVLR
eukprot:355873-Prorocentrum_minimum.AAC.2